MPPGVALLLFWTDAYAKYGGVKGHGSSSIYDGDLEPVNCAVLLCGITCVSRGTHQEGGGEEA